MRLPILWLAALALPLLTPRPAHAYVEAPQSLGSVVNQSTNVVLMTVTKIDKEKNLIIYQKVQDLKGKHPQDTIKHNIGRGGLRPGEWQEIMNWAEVGKQAVFFHNGGASETYIGATWYQAYPQGDWWGMSHAEPFLLRSYAGRVEKLPGLLADMLAGKEVVVPCMIDGDKEALHKKTAKVQRVKASLKLNDYNPKRDFVGWGGEEIRRLAGMPGFDRYAGIAKLDAEAQAVSVIDFDNDGKTDLTLCGANRVVLVQNGGDSFTEVALPGLIGGARAAVWADHNGDGLPDLLLATPSGPKLYTNLGQGRFCDDSRVLPEEPGYNLTAAAWGDFDTDGKPDILLANGFHGLRLYRNIRPADAVVKSVPPKLGDWYAIGPFRTTTNASNFDTKFTPETRDFDLTTAHKGIGGKPVKWTRKAYADGSVNSLAEFGLDCASYLYREIEVAAATELPVSFGSDDTITVWLNGERLLSENTQRACAPDQNRAVLKLKSGKNSLLIKICNGGGEHAFYFKPGTPKLRAEPWFEDATAAWGLGGDSPKGDTLAVADFNGDGKPDFLYGAGIGMLYLNEGNKFALRADSGIRYQPGKIGPALGDFDNDGRVDLFIPQTDGQCRLFRNVGNGTFSDATPQAGDLAKPITGAVSAAWGDFDNDGHADLLVCCLRGSNRYYRNRGNGTFVEQTADLGLTKKVFNSQAAAFADLNNDGQLDLILNNEAQESAIHFGAAKEPNGKTPVVVALNGTPGLNGGKVVVKDRSGKPVASACVSGGDCRGGNSLFPRFALAPGAYRVEVVGTSGKVLVRDLTVATSPVSVKLEKK